MFCPFCKIKLEETILCNTGVDFCPRCLGLWFAEDELRQAKDERDRNLGWLDIDLWKDEGEFKILPRPSSESESALLPGRQKLCPNCRLPLYEVQYGDSNLKVDVCNLCQGIWLDRGEFRKIISYLQDKAGIEILHNYVKNLVKQGVEIFSRRAVLREDILREEILDFLLVFKLLQYKFAAQHPVITQLIAELPK